MSAWVLLAHGSASRSGHAWWEWLLYGVLILGAIYAVALTFGAGRRRRGRHRSQRPRDERATR